MPFIYQPANVTGSKASNASGVSALMSMLAGALNQSGTPGANQTAQPADVGKAISDVSSQPGMGLIPGNLQSAMASTGSALSTQPSVPLGTQKGMSGY